MEVLDFANVEVSPAVDSRKQPKQAQGTDCSHIADIQQTIVHLCLGRDSHPTPIQRSVGEDRQQRWPVAPHGPFIGVGFPRQNLQRKGREGEDCRRQTQHISAIAPEPARQPVGPPRNFAIQPYAGHTAEETRPLHRRRFPRAKDWRNSTQIDFTDVRWTTAERFPRCQ